MYSLISPKEMHDSELAYYEALNGLYESSCPSLVIMENAARAIVSVLLDNYGPRPTVYIACGPSGNGGDGYAAARLLKEAGASPVVFGFGNPSTQDTRHNYTRCRQCGVPMGEISRLEDYPRPGVWLDALFGTGLNRNPEQNAKRLIQRMNRDRFAGSYTVSVDIPSGLNGLTGCAYENCVYADITVTIHRVKYGLLLGDGLDAAGRIQVASVGFPDSIFPENPGKCLEPEDLFTLYPVRRRNLHKGQCGHVLLIAGSFGMAGAASLAARAALRSGAGLVTVACPRSIVPILQTLAPSAMCVPLPETADGVIHPEALPVLRECLNGKTAIGIGCGLTTRFPEEVLELVLTCGLPAVIDADAITLMSRCPELLNDLNPLHVLTPHPGEAARLLGRPVENPLTDAQALSVNGAVVVLKGASRVITDTEQLYLSTSGTSAMARGGSGDILTGILAATLSEPSDIPAVLRCAAGCELHGLAGMLAEQRYSNRGMYSENILEFIPEVFKKYAS